MLLEFDDASEVWTRTGDWAKEWALWSDEGRLHEYWCCRSARRV